MQVPQPSLASPCHCLGSQSISNLRLTSSASMWLYPVASSKAVMMLGWLSKLNPYLWEEARLERWELPSPGQLGKELQAQACPNLCWSGKPSGIHYLCLWFPSSSLALRGMISCHAAFSHVEILVWGSQLGKAGNSSGTTHCEDAFQKYGQIVVSLWSGATSGTICFLGSFQPHYSDRTMQVPHSPLKTKQSKN